MFSTAALCTEGTPVLLTVLGTEGTPMLLTAALCTEGTPMLLTEALCCSSAPSGAMPAALLSHHMPAVHSPLTLRRTGARQEVPSQCICRPIRLPGNSCLAGGQVSDQRPAETRGRAGEMAWEAEKERREDGGREAEERGGDGVGGRGECKREGEMESEAKEERREDGGRQRRGVCSREGEMVWEEEEERRQDEGRERRVEERREGEMVWEEEEERRQDEGREGEESGGEERGRDGVGGRRGEETG
ncbi:hypothetical protein NDU88_007430 [Pleurodeles waltl]|uniref:Uncharacterized protein n=1 Tax=Pleurodeles waltl TaxID=8319 RepID=A0AAV7MQ75_PLEWA|nr:hypothetical protein NDU88_007430 [Pleurodeles waltl]